jgi:IS30 family transposase
MMVRIRNDCRGNATRTPFLLELLSLKVYFERTEGVVIAARVPGHLEGDLLSGAKNSYIATLVERHSRFAMLNRVRSKETEVVVAALSRHVLKLPAALKRSLTWDRGLEMATHKNFTVATDVQVYFRDPQSPCQHGTNENTNLLLRQYFPRRTGRINDRERP